MEKRVYNFSAGPSMLPLGGSGTGTARTGLLPFSRHLSGGDEPPFKTFENILEKAKADLKELMHIPDNYKILFLQGWRLNAVCDDSHEPDEQKQQGGLCDHRAVGEEGGGRGRALR